MDKKIIIGVGVIALILLAVFVVKPKNNLINSSTTTGATKVQVFLFHATQRCPTCIRIGELAEATVKERFADQLKSGKIEFREVNIDLPENKALVEKFKATGSALYINSIKDGQDNIAEDTMVWQFASGYEIKFKDYFSNKLNTILEI